ncbi:N-formylglutamate amidohydrolase [Phaeovulum sp.]|uniref:N-formylglutamate amidohydrolase n=1 Tax=Phaeovulum sp. TaxID=2934796 RepID=UPI002730D39F|nr:N-formylglutamate amidohydrolase [Phaeovulum sp.]MDP1668413.1 N-formylglutamate amidohydrolase [Phaeovulum sp.]MDZ4120092.1 N-formylglutamate amidohydrolase [Phaeovulum sp.]
MTFTGQIRLPFVTADEAVELFNPGGSFPCLLVCDHASADVPPEFGSLGLAVEDLRRHIGVDIGIAQVVRALAVLLDAPAVLARQSRLLIDCNRWIADPESIACESDGIRVPANRQLDQAARSERQDRFFWPYHRAINKALETMQARHPAPLFLALHSCSRQLGAETRNIDGGTFWHESNKMSSALIDVLSRERALVLADNAPYSGFRGTSFTLDYHTWGTGLDACGFEIVNDEILTPQDQARWTARLAEAILEARKGTTC